MNYEYIFTTIRKGISIVSLIVFLSPLVSAQTTLFSDDFSSGNNSTYTTSGGIGTSLWSVSRSGNDWGARRNSNTLQLTNDVGSTNNANGWVYAALPVSSFSCYQLSLSNNSGPLTWSFNMRQSQNDPGGFGNNTFGVAFVLAATDANVATSGSGYAVVLGQSGTTDPLRLVRFNNGLRGSLSNIISSNTSGLTDFGTQYLSVRVVYTPTTDTWQLYLRNDGSSAFTNPATGSLTLQGTAIDNNYTSSNIVTMGAYWQGGTASGQSALFDNVLFTKTLAAPGIGAISQPTCSTSTGSVALTGLPTTGNWLITQSPGGNTYTGSGSSTTISGLAPNTYNFTVSDYNYGYQAIVSGCGYTATIVIEPLSIVVLDDPCTFGYNYNVEFNYTITVTGENTCWNGDIGFQPQIFCNSQNNGNYTILTPAPTVGAPAGTTVYRGTLTTQTRPWNPNSDCATATIVNQNCNRVDVTVYGPGIASATFPTTVTTSSSCPSASSANVVINPVSAPTITAQPVSLNACGNASGSFSVAASGSGLTYEWQRRPAGTPGSWTAIGSAAGATGANTSDLNITGLSSNGWDNYLVRAVINPGGCSAISDSALITVSTAPTAPTAISGNGTIISSTPSISSFAVSTGSGNSISVNKPNGLQTGDMILAGLTLEKGSAVNITPPSGWTLINRTNQSTDVGMASYYKIATAADVAASTFNFTVNNTPKWSIALVRITDFDPVSPIAGVNAQASSTSGTSVTAPSVNNIPANSLVLAFYTNKKNATYQPASGTTEIYDNPNNAGGEPSNMMAYFYQAATGSTPSRTATASIAERWAAQQIAINPNQSFGLCLGRSLVLTATGGSNGSGSYYEWGTGSVGSNILPSTGQSITVTVAGAESYWVRRVGNTGCTSSTAAATANTNVLQPDKGITVNGVAIGAGDYLWTGNISSLWSAKDNWYWFNGSDYALTTTLPDSINDVYVVSPAQAVQCVTTGQATIDQSNYTIRSMSIGSNAQVTITGTNDFSVKGDWANLGTFVPSNSTVVFNGLGSQFLLSGQGTSVSNSAKEFWKMQISKSAASRLTLLDNLKVQDSLTIVSGELYIPSISICKAKSTFTHPSGLITVQGQLRLNE
ncbi:MAG: hypothetical protein SFW35_02515 [Chitinophagales bacterium]|nr:hypothetical protein [Chitinophagales bacterium]